MENYLLFLIILGFTFIFSLFDYFGYNISARNGWVNEKLINSYRIIQTSVQIILTLIALFVFNWKVAVGFNLLWWTWNCDLLFYFIGDILGVYGRGWFKSEVINNQVSWAWWTPYGIYDLLKNGKQNGNYRIIKGSILLFQAFLGLILTIFISFYF